MKGEDLIHTSLCTSIQVAEGELKKTRLPVNATKVIKNNSQLTLHTSPEISGLKNKKTYTETPF